MALLSISNLNLAFGNEIILDGVNLTLAPGEHVGLVGRNGTGKSTLMKLIIGSPGIVAQGGQIQLARGASVGYLSQHHELNLDRTLREEAGQAFSELARLHKKIDEVTHEMADAEGDQLDKLMKKYDRLEQQLQAAGGYAVDHRIDEALHGLGLDDAFFNVKVRDLSGGQKGRLALAKLLLSEPDLLLLDEPTNHLDIAGRQWLEEFLRGYSGAVILISHDRWLLDRAVSAIYELERGELVRYPGNYMKFRELREERRIALQRVFDKQQTKIRQEQAFIDRYRAGQRSKQAQGREKRLERYKRDELVESPVELDTMTLNFSPKNRSGDMVLSADAISKRYDDNVLFDTFSLVIKRGSRIGIIGPNGAGKSTLIKCLIGEMQPDNGTARIGSQVSVGHYRQTHEHLDLSQSVVQFMQRFVPSGTDQEARNLAGAFLFTGLEQDKVLNVLSGGERSRAVLATLITGGHNLLILDEPTNHLDIPSSERLEEALCRYTAEPKGYGQNAKQGGGTMILISHDRMLLENTVNELIVFEGNGRVKHFLGTYSEYLAQKKSLPAESPAPRQTTPARASEPKEKKEKKSAPQPAKKKRGPLASMSIQAIEEKIVEIESRLASVDQQLADPDTYRDSDTVKQLQKLRDDLQGKLKPLEEEWADRAEDAAG